MSVVIKNNGTDITSRIKTKAFSFTEEINYKRDIVKFNYLVSDSKATPPQLGDEIRIYIDGTLRFCGEVDDVDISTSNSKVATHSITVSDVGTVLDKILVNRPFIDMTTKEILVDIIGNELLAYGFTVGTIDNVGTDLGDVLFDFKKFSDIISDLADYTSCYWTVNPDKSIDFKTKGTTLATDIITDNTDIYLPNTLSINKNTKQIRNVIYIIGSDEVGVLTPDNVGQGNGVQKTFRLPYVYNEVPTVKVNNVVKTVGVAYLNDTGYDCYWDQRGRNLIFDVAVVDTHDVDVEGKPLIPIMLRYSAGGTGKQYATRIIDKTLKTVEAAEARARAEVENYAKEITTASFRTEKNTIRVGQKITINSVLYTTNAEYIVQKITTVVSGSKVFYDVALASHKDYDLVDLFRHLLRKGEKEYGFFRTGSEILRDYAGVPEKIEMQEDWSITYGDIIPEKIEATDRVYCVYDVRPTYVWGDYEIIDDSDPKRTPVWDSGVTWG